MIWMIKKAAAPFAAVAVIFTAAACGGEPVEGNLAEVKKDENANEIYAVFTIRTFGDITAKLFPGAAPNAVERFTENAERGYYDGSTIHRVIQDYVIQGGSLNGDGSDGNVPGNLYFPVETTAVTYNFYGALCLAASKKGCYSQFYIVNNNVPQDIDAAIETISGQLADESVSSRLLPEDKTKYEEYLKKLQAIPAEVKEKYKRTGGLYDLDGTSTVMGQVIDGFDVLEAVSSVEVVSGNKADDKAGMPSKPLESIIIDKIEIIRITPQNTEATTTKKPAKTKKTSEMVNAESLAPSPLSGDTTAAENTGSADTTISAGADDTEPGQAEFTTNEEEVVVIEE
ncbi:MAG: peptidylprolyl isomerase [Ruminiclostridium sp.]|nr:peptidylprolyl isomerase [Ruminiclostridium sp.]